MAGFLSRLGAQAMGSIEVARPRVPARFEPGAGAHPRETTGHEAEQVPEAGVAPKPEIASPSVNAGPTVQPDRGPAPTPSPIVVPTPVDEPPGSMIPTRDREPRAPGRPAVPPTAGPAEQPIRAAARPSPSPQPAPASAPAAAQGPSPTVVPPRAAAVTPRAGAPTMVQKAEVATPVGPAAPRPSPPPTSAGTTVLPPGRADRPRGAATEPPTGAAPQRTPSGTPDRTSGSTRKATPEPSSDTRLERTGVPDRPPFPSPELRPDSGGTPMPSSPPAAAAEATVIEVRIGRIDVHAPPAPAVRRGSSALDALPSLADVLARRRDR